MSKITKIVVPVFILFILYAIYILSPTDEVGSFDKIRAGGEINQSVNVQVVGSKGFKKDPNGNIISFYARDKNGQEALVNLREPVGEEIVSAKVVELFGHMHSDTFVAIRASVVK